MRANRPEMNYVRRGRGEPLLLIHGLGGSWQSWNPVLADLAAEREVIAVDLPGFGETPPLAGEASLSALAEAVSGFLARHGLTGIDAVGSSMGAQITLELVRRGGTLGAAVSLDPGGFWRGWERLAFYASTYLSIRLVRLLQPAMPSITAHPLTRELFFAQISARPRELSPQLLLSEMRSFATAESWNELLWHVAFGPEQRGVPRGTLSHPLVIGWGRRDYVCFPRQAARAAEAFPDGQVHWFDRCGHFPHWDRPDETTRLILAATGS